MLRPSRNEKAPAPTEATTNRPRPVQYTPNRPFRKRLTPAQRELSWFSAMHRAAQPKPVAQVPLKFAVDHAKRYQQPEPLAPLRPATPPPSIDWTLPRRKVA